MSQMNNIHGTHNSNLKMLVRTAQSTPEDNTTYHSGVLNTEQNRTDVSVQQGRVVADTFKITRTKSVTTKLTINM